VSALGPPHVLTIADLRERARRRMPRVVFDYVDGGAEGEITLRENCSVFDEVTFRPRGAIELPGLDLSTRIAGERLAVPYVLAPVGSTRLFYPHGEELAARVASDLGTAYTLSTLSGTRLEAVRVAAAGTLWYQLYLVGGRDVASAAILRAKAAGYKALVMTIDTPVAGYRQRDLRDGIKELLSRNPFRMFPHVWQFLARPAWLARFFADGGLMSFPNVVLPSGPMPYADVGVALEQSVVTWADLRWIRELWDGPLIIKGVLTAEDARRAADEGATAIVVSNHGGRQLDGVSSTLRVLPEISAAVGERLDVLFDGGIRRGGDIVKALCLGARAVLVGRAYIYGLGAGGGPGVARALEILHADLVRTMRLLGCGKVGELEPSYLGLPSGWPQRR
jgi:isopentenyl diphosphate isomerase/L-lactate dehydrogenase-like FMN-dependent dehydrogenase